MGGVFKQSSLCVRPRWHMARMHVWRDMLIVQWGAEHAADSLVHIVHHIFTRYKDTGVRDESPREQQTALNSRPNSRVCATSRRLASYACLAYQEAVPACMRQERVAGALRSREASGGGLQWHT